LKVRICESNHTQPSKMHELSIAQNIVEIIQEHVPRNGLPLVKNVKLKIGELAGVVPDSLEFCFDAITERTPMHNAVLVVEHVPFVVECRKCGKVSKNDVGTSLCAGCGSDETRMVSGNELLVMAIEVLDEKELTA
jgi:hydrogenase nickel incorporation protein HypA/HybF